MGGRGLGGGEEVRGEREKCGRDAVRGEGAVEGGEEVCAEVEEFLGELV